MPARNRISIPCTNSTSYAAKMFGTSTKTFKPGNPAPAFELPTAGGRIVRLLDFRGKPLIIVFIRGTW